MNDAVQECQPCNFLASSESDQGGGNWAQKLTGGKTLYHLTDTGIALHRVDWLSVKKHEDGAALQPCHVLAYWKYSINKCQTIANSIDIGLFRDTFSVYRGGRTVHRVGSDRYINSGKCRYRFVQLHSSNGCWVLRLLVRTLYWFFSSIQKSCKRYQRYVYSCWSSVILDG